MSSGEKRNRYILNNMGSFISNNGNNKFNSTSITKILILKLLSEKSRYGHELMDEIEKIFGYTWRPSPGMIYPLLIKMRDDMLIDGDWDIPDKKSTRTYFITDEGLKHYKVLLNIYKPIINEAENMIKMIKSSLYE